MSGDIFALAERGAAVMAEIQTKGESPERRAKLDQIATLIRDSWQSSDIESIEAAPTHVRGLSSGDLEGFARFWLRHTKNTVAIVGRCWPYRLIHFYWERGKK